MIRRVIRTTVIICRTAILLRLVPIRITENRIRASRRNRIIITNRTITVTARRAAARAIVRQSA